MALADDTLARSFCDAPPHDEVCPVLPKDNTDFDSSFIYLNLEKNAQNPFDIFSWQTFVALNWPADETGAPIGEPIGTRPNRPRVWQSYARRADVFGFAHEEAEPCLSGEATKIATSQIFQFDGKALIDRDLNYIVFDTRLNGQVEEYIVANGLDSTEGQRRFRQTGRKVDFPRGHYRDKPTRGPAASSARSRSKHRGRSSAAARATSPGLTTRPMHGSRCRRLGARPVERSAFGRASDSSACTSCAGPKAATAATGSGRPSNT